MHGLDTAVTAGQAQHEVANDFDNVIEMQMPKKTA
jgi:hypothetical protein